LEQCRPAIEDGTPVRAEVKVTNVNRTVGTLLGYEITRRHGGAGLPEGTIDLTFRGSAGQSFGAFLPKGVTMRLLGDTNDYLGKGLSGGRIIVRPPDESTFPAEDNIVAGNVILYGATAGDVFLRGQVGERFCVRNSGAIAVVEGVGDHGCEYMTGGRVVVLGPTGRNFAAGMSGGIAFVYDPHGLLIGSYNRDLVDLEQPLSADDRVWLKDRITMHRDETGSEVARAILADWVSASEQFVTVMPQDYRRVLEATERAVAEGRSVEQAVMEASHG
jgi:glutamate synthase (NADPH/NADH) large chain